jgi:hypothetical protein
VLTKGLARAGDLVVMGFGPDPDAAEGGAEAAAERCELVFDARRDDGIDGAPDQPVTFHLTYGFGEHLLADAGDEPAELGEANRAVLLKDFEDQHGPFVGDALDDLADEPVDFGVGAGRRLRMGELPFGDCDLARTTARGCFHFDALSLG